MSHAPGGHVLHRPRRVLIAEDDPVSLRLLEAKLANWGYEPVSCRDGSEALEALECSGAPRLLILDWMMPGVDGTEVCRRARAAEGGDGLYILILTARGRAEDIVEGLEAGADDYVVKPFRPAEFQARLQVGERVLQLRERLDARVRELEDALSRVRELEGLLPICSYCKRVRDDRDYWEHIESYLSTRLSAQFTHSVCPHCYEQHVKPELDALDREISRSPDERRHG